MTGIGPRRLGSAYSGPLARLRFWLLLVAGLARPTLLSVAQTAPPAAACGPAAPSVAAAATLPPGPCPPPLRTGPQAWGYIGFDGYFTGLRPAPDGLSYNPLLSVYSNLDYGLLPHKWLYLFLDNDFWAQRNSTAFSGVSQREFDALYGIAWNYWDSMELRVFGYTMNNLNRGVSLAAPQDYKDGYGVENRYYFHSQNIYDLSRLGYVSLGYLPSQALVGNNGESFKPGLFARGYLTESLPTPFASYLYGGLGVTDESGAGSRLFDGDFGVAVRPVVNRQNLEFRVGDAFSDDLKAGETRNYVYGSVRLAFEAGQSSGGAPDPASPPLLNWPEAWGAIGLAGYVGSSRMAPNGVPFSPIFGITSELNLGLLPHKQLYLFWDGDFWAQHSAGLTLNNQNPFAYSKREMDSNLGLAWNYIDAWELRGSVYALNNLNRGDSLAVPTGGNEGIILENRYNFVGPDPYDVGRTSFVGFGYIPTENLVGGNGASFRPGAFAHAYLARDLPVRSFRSYLYADMQVIAEHTALPRLLDSDVGWAVRPVAHWQNLELRLGDELVQDTVAATTRNMIYGAVRLDFGPRRFGSLVP
jgi:hypothetical protein